MKVKIDIDLDDAKAIMNALVLYHQSIDAAVNKAVDPVDSSVRLNDESILSMLHEASAVSKAYTAIQDQLESNKDIKTEVVH